jgi:hypothetical protein
MRGKELFAPSPSTRALRCACRQAETDWESAFGNPDQLARASPASEMVETAILALLMPIKGSILYPFRWFWRQDISTQVQLPSPAPSTQPAQIRYAIKKTRPG